ncbi:hypothetical protein FRC0195_01940 [Corynebacterium diphtheriae]|nr:hypothetical protein FRC0195_01940 [Corynebacterium diphtheriae]
MPGDQQAMGVDAVGSAGDEGHQIPVRLHRQPIGLVGQYDVDGLDLVLQLFARHRDVEDVADGDLLQVVEQRGVGQARVGGDHRVRRVTADGKVRAEEVAGAALQHRFRRPVEHREIGVRGGHDDAAHRLLIGEFRQVGLVFGVVVADAGEPRVQDRAGDAFLVVAARGVQRPVQLFLGQVALHFRVLLCRPQLLGVVPLGGHDRVQHDEQADDDEHDGDRDVLALAVSDVARWPIFEDRRGGISRHLRLRVFFLLPFRGPRRLAAVGVALGVPGAGTDDQRAEADDEADAGATGQRQLRGDGLDVLDLLGQRHGVILVGVGDLCAGEGELDRLGQQLVAGRGLGFLQAVLLGDALLVVFEIRDVQAVDEQRAVGTGGPGGRAVDADLVAERGLVLAAVQLERGTFQHLSVLVVLDDLELAVVSLHLVGRHRGVARAGAIVGDDRGLVLDLRGAAVDFLDLGLDGGHQSLVDVVREQLQAFFVEDDLRHVVPVDDLHRGLVVVLLNLGAVVEGDGDVVRGDLDSRVEGVDHLILGDRPAGGGLRQVGGDLVGDDVADVLIRVLDGFLRLVLGVLRVDVNVVVPAGVGGRVGHRHEDQEGRAGDVTLGDGRFLDVVDADRQVAEGDGALAVGRLLGFHLLAELGGRLGGGELLRGLDVVVVAEGHVDPPHGEAGSRERGAQSPRVLVAGVMGLTGGARTLVDVDGALGIEVDRRGLLLRLRGGCGCELQDSGRTGHAGDEREAADGGEGGGSHDAGAGVHGDASFYFRLRSAGAARPSDDWAALTIPPEVRSTNRPITLLAVPPQGTEDT